jgi:hypothetical protein
MSASKLFLQYVGELQNNQAPATLDQAIAIILEAAKSAADMTKAIAAIGGMIYEKNGGDFGKHLAEVFVRTAAAYPSNVVVSYIVSAAKESFPQTA